MFVYLRYTVAIALWVLTYQGCGWVGWVDHVVRLGFKWIWWIVETVGKTRIWGVYSRNSLGNWRSGDGESSYLFLLGCVSSSLVFLVVEFLTASLSSHGDLGGEATRRTTVRRVGKVAFFGSLLWCLFSFMDRGVVCLDHLFCCFLLSWARSRQASWALAGFLSFSVLWSARLG